jgi:hypothetical protein
MSENCPHCMMRSIEAARERDDFTRMLAAMIDAAGGEIRVSDRSIAFSQGPVVPDVEIFRDEDNRCTVIRKAQPPMLSVFKVPFVMRPDGRPTQILKVQPKE